MSCQKFVFLHVILSLILSAFADCNYAGCEHEPLVQVPATLLSSNQCRNNQTSSVHCPFCNSSVCLSVCYRWNNLPGWIPSFCPSLFRGQFVYCNLVRITKFGSAYHHKDWYSASLISPLCDWFLAFHPSDYFSVNSLLICKFDSLSYDW